MTAAWATGPGCRPNRRSFFIYRRGRRLSSRAKTEAAPGAKMRWPIILMVNRILDPNSERRGLLDARHHGGHRISPLVAWASLRLQHRVATMNSGSIMGGFNKCQPYYIRSVELYAHARRGENRLSAAISTRFPPS